MLAKFPGLRWLDSRQPAVLPDTLPLDLAAEVLRGGLADPARLLRNDTGQAGLPLSVTKPLSLGVLNNRHKVTGEVSRRPWRPRPR